MLKNFIIPCLIAVIAGIGNLRAAPEKTDPPANKSVSQYALVNVCSSGNGDLPENHFCLVRGPVLNPAFVTDKEQLPWVTLDLRATPKITAIDITNAKGKAGIGNTELTVEISLDNKTWTQVFQAGDKPPGAEWKIKLGQKSAPARYVRISLKQSNPRVFQLNRVVVYGESK